MLRQIFILSLLLVFIISSCKSEQKSQIQNLAKTEKKAKEKKQQSITSKTPYQTAKSKAYQWTTNLDFDMDYIVSKKRSDKKHLAELLGIYWKLYKSSNSIDFKKEIKQRVLVFYNYTKLSKYHNMNLVSDKLFKKNSMSYLRVMWLLKELDFDITTYNNEVNKILPRMNTHLKTRGNWQKEVFKEYYSAFNYKIPKVLQSNQINNGIIDSKLAFEKYDKTSAYNFTHFVFAGFEYGNKTTQNRFDQVDVAYIKEILPKLTKKYRVTTPNIDLLGEFFTCMVYMGFTDTPEFKKTYQYLLANQNKDGSWGNYEKYRKKLGKDIDFRAYLHTSLVVLEGLLEYNEGDFSGSKK